jgi:tryptophan synthase beta chain
MMVRDFQRVLGEEAREQYQALESGLPDAVIACIGGGSNAAGSVCAFVGDADVQLIGVEAGGFGLESGKHAARIITGEVGILHGSKSYVLQDENGQIKNAHSVSAGLDYPGVGPEHSMWADEGRVDYHSITDAEALEAFHELTRLEGILPALESSHAVAEAKKVAKDMGPDKIIVVNLSGRGDKDLDSVLGMMQNNEG